jgi:predicted CXXCH cytochrome family protein
MMNKQPLAVFVILLISFFFVADGTVGQEGKGKVHPTLVSLEASNCTTCHDSLANKKYLHSVLKESGCDSCHELTKTNNKIMVGFVEEGNALCFVCHSDIEEAAGKEYPHPVLEEGCATCHQPHSSDHPELLVSSMEELCANCHEIGEEAFKKKHGLQPVARLGCSSCHDAHGSDAETLLIGTFKHVPFQEGQCNACHKRPRGKVIRLRSTGAKLCYACHGDKEKEFSAFPPNSIHRPIQKGECSGCHDPHMANHKGLLEDKGKRLCLKCHTDIKALLEKENIHPPAEESCQDCHAAHGSKHTALLNDKEVDLCLNCHDAEEESFTSKHYQQKPDDLTCSECHNPHGSGGPKLLNTYAHPPFKEKECDTCHDGLTDDKKIKLAAEDTSELCLNCHDDKAPDDTGKGLSRHGALEVGSCTACHSAHAASQNHLVKAHTSRLCLTCHEDRAEERGKLAFVHPVIDSIGCEACHDSHFAKNDGLLLETANRLCNGCHLQGADRKSSGQTVTLFGKLKLRASELNAYKKILLSADLSRGHPQQGHPVSGTVTPKSIKNKRLRGLSFSGEMTCLSCHDPHAGAAPQLFVNRIAGRFQLCLTCHKK